MAFKVVVSPSAFGDIDEVSRYIAERVKPERAERRKGGVLFAIRGLREMPERCAIIPEAQSLGVVYRHLHYHSHRIVFTLDEPTQTVFVLRVVHGARRALRLSDLP